MKISSIFSFYHFKYITYSWLTASHVTHLKIVQRGILAMHAFMNIFEHHKVNESHWWFDWEIDKNFERKSLPEHQLLGIVYSCTTSGHSKLPNSRSHGQHTLWSNIHLISWGDSICKTIVLTNSKSSNWFTEKDDFSEWWRQIQPSHADSDFALAKRSQHHLKSSYSLSPWSLFQTGAILRGKVGKTTQKVENWLTFSVLPYLKCRLLGTVDVTRGTVQGTRKMNLFENSFSPFTFIVSLSDLRHCESLPKLYR